MRSVKLCAIALVVALCPVSHAKPNHDWEAMQAKCENLRAAIGDLSATFGTRYTEADGYLQRLASVEARLQQKAPQASADLEKLRSEALLANPLLDCRILMVKRKAKNPITGIAIPAPHESNSGLKRAGYDNELAILDVRNRQSRTTSFYRPENKSYVGEVDLHFDGERILFTRSDSESWKLWEMNLDGTGLRQVSQAPPDVDCFDACYLPDGRIVFASTASYQSVPCHHGQMPAGHLYLMNSDGSGMRQLCFDQDIDAHPVVLNNGQVMFSRWDYTGINHIFLRQLMVMNPDGTGQKAVYGSNSWFPNSLFFPRPLPGGGPGELVSILSGYHGVPRMGWLVLMDTSRGWRDAEGLVKRISGKGDPITPIIKDNAVDGDWPKFLHPYPLSEKYFLVSVLRSRNSNWELCLADAFDNVISLYRDPEYAVLEPVVIAPRPKPPAIPDRVDLSKGHGTVYLQDIHAGPGLQGVPRGVVKKLRVLSYHFGYRGLAGSDKIGYGGPWDGMQIEGTVEVEEDGSALFEVPANTPLALQPLDEEGKAVQLMRSWFTLMPGERLSCIGCHESPKDPPLMSPTLAAARKPDQINPWHGPARGFDFAREVQPVITKHCVACHDGEDAAPDLRPEEQVKEPKTWPIGYPDRLTAEMKKDTGGRMTYTPAYDALIHYIRRVGIEDTVSLLEPGEYHADTSPLIQMLRKGHHGVELSTENWDRLVTWIDLNAPCHGTWGEVYPIPNRAHQRRMELRAKYGGATRDPEAIPAMSKRSVAPAKPKALQKPEPLKLPGWPMTREQAAAAQGKGGRTEISVDLGEGVILKLVRIPAGRFVMGSVEGEADEWPEAVVSFDRPFWMGATEITNEQFRRFDPSHDSGHYARRLPRPDSKGMPLNSPDQAVVRVSWKEAMGFCRWTSEETGLDVDLPTEAQWEYSCRAGSGKPMSYGDADADFSPFANLADETFSRGVLSPQKVHPNTVSQWSGGVPHLVLEGAKLSETRFRDNASVTAAAGSFRSNAWGLHDMHGNAAEWTCSLHASYPYQDADGRNETESAGRRVVRGGSFFDPPKRSRSSFRLGYHPWQRPFNVGFRVVCKDADLKSP